MKIKELIEMLQILVTYCELPEDEYVTLSHDEIVTGPTSMSKISLRHLLRLEELGWRFDELEECWRKLI